MSPEQLAFDRGRAARGKKASNPYAWGPERYGVTESQLTALYHAWQAGYEEDGVGRKKRAKNYSGASAGEEPVVEVAPLPIETPRVEYETLEVPKLEGRTKWPDDQDLPAYYVRGRARDYPCPSCRRIKLESGSQAVVPRMTTRALAYLRCRACNHHFKAIAK